MKTILITGARSGIMNQVIHSIKDRYIIYVTVRTDNQLKRIKEKYKNEKNIKCYKLDITDEKDRNLLSHLNIDILINNAAVNYGGSLIDMDINKIKENYEVNVFSSLLITQIVLKKMIQDKKGKIINMASLAGIVPICFIGSYSSTKSAIIKITETLKKELNKISNIKVSMIEPGFYDTGFNQVMFDNKDIDLYFSHLKNQINQEQEFIHRWIEKKNLNSIVKKIIKCIDSKNPKFIYRTPFSQVVFSKLYTLFFQ